MPNSGIQNEWERKIKICKEVWKEKSEPSICEVGERRFMKGIFAGRPFLLLELQIRKFFILIDILCFFFTFFCYWKKEFCTGDSNRGLI